MTTEARSKKLLKNASTVKKDGREYRIRPVCDEYSLDKLVEYYYSTSPTEPDTMEDGSTVFYDEKWFIIRDYGNGKQQTIAIITA